MSPVEFAWAMVPILVALAALMILVKVRRGTVDYAESRVARANTPGWLKGIELAAAAAFLFLLSEATARIYIFARGPLAGLAGVSALFVVLGIGSIVLPLAFLGANAFSWMVPFLRNANLDACRGTHVSFRSASMGLIKFACVSVPFGVAVLWIAAVAPWAR